MPTTIIALNGTCILCFGQDSETVDHAPELAQYQQNLYIDHNTIYRELMDMANAFDAISNSGWTSDQLKTYANRHDELLRVGDAAHGLYSLRYPHSGNAASMDGAYAQVAFKQP